MLRPPCGHPGASSSPLLAADAAVHTGTSPSSGHRAATAAAAPATADTAAATGPGELPASPDPSRPGQQHRENTRTSSARPANRRSHPRTVGAGQAHQPGDLWGAQLRTADLQ